MKKKLFLATIVLMLGCSVSFAQNDAFFASSYQEYREVDNEWGTMPVLPTEHGGFADYSAVPVGSGLLLLAGLGLAYGMRKSKRQ
ncbi:MAG: hypothetical protein IKD32_00985 [Bacteroidales bacterium]|nr:hypothetical protein [Bacteroidales bacterium]